MDLNYFKDQLFDLLNESEMLSVSEITSDEHTNTFIIHITDGSKFEIKCQFATNSIDD